MLIWRTSRVVSMGLLHGYTGALWEYFCPSTYSPIHYSEWAQRSLAIFQHLATIPNAAHINGVSVKEGCWLFTHPVPDPSWAHLLPHYRSFSIDATERSYWQFPSSTPYSYSQSATVPIIHMPTYMKWLMDELKSKGVEIEQDTVYRT